MNQKKIEIFILTFNKEINEDYDPSIYKPLVCGGGLKVDDSNYLQDNTGDNISHLNKYYSELTGEYWAWKNSDAEIIGFCHYRRWYVKNIRWDKITKQDILDDLEEYDIILPHHIKYLKSLYDIQKELDVRLPNYDVKYDDYVNIRHVLEKFFPDYASCYDTVMNGRIMWGNNMFICKRELANKYFEWLFEVLSRLMEELDLTQYESRDTRIFGFIAERLFTTFILKNKLKFKEYDILLLDRKLPILQILGCRYPLILELEYHISKFLGSK